jgi:toxin ParE1/3/4
MAKAKWTLPAREDLKEIGLYIGRKEHRPSIAANILREINAKCDGYSQAFASGSVIGSDASSLGEGCRILSHKRWVIVFETVDNGIEVLRVLDGSRDYPRLFGSLLS